LASLTVGQLSNYAGDGFNVTETNLNNFLMINFFAADNPGEIYSLKLNMISEGIMSNGRVTLAGQPIALNGNPATIKIINNSPVSINTTYLFRIDDPYAMGKLRLLEINTAFWLLASKINVCPDINVGRFCVKMTVKYHYLRINDVNPNPFLIFIWQLADNAVLPANINVGTTNTQILDNLGFFSIENIANVLNAQTGIAQFLPVTTELRTDNIQTNGIWVIYQLGTSRVVHTTHDPVFGINQTGPMLTLQIVIIILSVTLVGILLVIVSCSIYICRGSTQKYYTELRMAQEEEPIFYDTVSTQSEELVTD